MANVTNNHYGPLAVGGVTIAPGKTAKVEKWDTVKDNPVIQTWLDRAVIAVESGKAEKPAEKSLDEMTKAELVAEAEARGMTLDEGMTKAQILDALKA